MALAFGNTDYVFSIQSPAAVVPSTGSFVCVWNPQFTPGDGVAHTIFDQRVTGDEGNTTISIGKYLDNNWYCGWYNHGEYRVVVAAAGTFTQNADHWIGLTWDDTANETKFYINGAQVGSTSTSLVAFTPDNHLTFGQPSSASDGGNQTLSEMGLYNAVLTLADMVSLYRGFSPLLVRRAALTHYWPVVRYDTFPSDLVGDSILTVAGVPTIAVQPRVIYPSRRRVFFQPPASTRRFLLVRR